MSQTDPSQLPRFVWQRRALARRNDTSPETLNDLVVAARSGAAMHKETSVRAAVADSRNAFPGTLAILAQDPNSHVRRAAAANPRTPLPARAALTWDATAEVRAAAVRSEGMAHRIAAAKRIPIARNVYDLSTADEAISSLLRGDKLSYFTNGAERPEVLSVLAHSGRKDLRSFVLRNGHTDSATLEFLASFVSLTVIPHDGPDYEIARHRNTPPTVLARLASHTWGLVRAEVASNPNTPASALDALSSDPALNVVRSVANNRNTPTSTLRRLAYFPDTPEPSTYLTGSFQQPHHDPTSGADVRRAVAGNPQTPAEELFHLARHGFAETVAENSATTAAILRWIAKHKKPKRYGQNDITIRGVASHPNSPRDVLDLVAEKWDDNEYVCEALAQNPNTPAETLRVLGENSNWSVRAAASQAMSERGVH